VFSKIILCLLAVVVVFLLVQSIMLKTFGVTTNATVYYARQEELRNEDDHYDPTRSELSYRYTVDGKTYEGKNTMYFEHGYVTEMGADGKEIPKTAVVRYLPSIPRWSEIVSVPGGKHGSNLIVGSFGWIGFGLLVMILAVMIIRTRRARKKAKAEI